MNATFTYWTRMMAANVAAAIVVVLTFSRIDARTPWGEWLEAFGVALLFAMCTGPLLTISMPRLGPYVWDRFAFPINWAVMVAAMIVLAAIGCLAAISILGGIGYLPWSQFAAWFGRSIRVAIVVTLTFGIFVTAYELLRARLEETTLALRTLERDEAEARRLATEAQLASLESRVHPHFLFNTLNSIASLIPSDPAGAERMIGRLASLLRSSLDAGGSGMVALEQELGTVRDYLEIERVRFGHRLRYAIDVPAELTAAAVPKLSLQTVVENSVKYAVSPSRDGATIAVRASRANGHLRLDVEDDGPGFESMSLPAHHGLALLRERLRMTMGPAARLSVHRVDRLTVVRIDPAVRPLCAFIVDDERLAVERLTRLLEATGRVTIAGSATDSVAALDALRTADVDVLFLDIQMPALSGFELLEGLNRDIPVIFTTAFDQYAIDAFATNSVDYLLKPIEPERLDRAIDKLLRLAGLPRPDVRSLARELAAALASPGKGRRLDRVASRVGERTTVLDVARITHFFSKDKLTFAAAGGREHVVDHTLGELEERLDPRRFVRVHRATIVNLAFVQEIYPGIDGVLVRLKDDARTELSVARDRVRDLKERLGI